MVSNQDLRRAERELLIQAFRQPKKNERGGSMGIDKRYLDKNVWIQIEDAFIFKQIFPTYVHFIANEIDEWYIFVKKTHKGLKDVEEYKNLKNDLLKKYEKELANLLYKTNKTKTDIDNMNYFEFLELTETFDKNNTNTKNSK